MKKWYVLAVQTRKEQYVERQLKAAGHTVVCPRYIKNLRRARQISQVRAPLFPGYIFVKLNLKIQGWRDVNCAPGSIGFVKFNKQPSPLHSSFIDEFISNIDETGILRSDQQIRVGDQVMAIGGPFDRLIGKVVAMSEANRIKVLMDALNRKVEMTLPKTTVLVAA